MIVATPGESMKPTCERSSTTVARGPEQRLELVPEQRCRRRVDVTAHPHDLVAAIDGVADHEVHPRGIPSASPQKPLSAGSGPDGRAAGVQGARDPGQRR